MEIRHPHLLFLGDARDSLAIKTAQGLVDWRPDWCLGQLRFEGCGGDTGLADLSISAAVERGAHTMILGVANAGGVLPESWTETIVGALEAGLDVASGMHMRLTEVPEIRKAAAEAGQSLFDVRHPEHTFETGKGVRREGKRLLTVGTDCSVGKMYATLAIEREMQARNMDGDFRATGQTGILIAGSGVPVDAVPSDFISGAVEFLSPANDPDHWDLVEGQGSLAHPSFAGVSLGILHGAQPDVLVMCHEPTRTHMRGLTHQPLPDIEDCIAENERAARLTNPDTKCIGIAINTSELPLEEARDYLDLLEERLGLPCVDPIATGVSRLVDVIG